MTTSTEVTEVETVSEVVPPDEVRTCETYGEVANGTVVVEPSELMMVVEVDGENGDELITEVSV